MFTVLIDEREDSTAARCLYAGVETLNQVRRNNGQSLYEPLIAPTIADAGRELARNHVSTTFAALRGDRLFERAMGGSVPSSSLECAFEHIRVNGPDVGTIAVVTSPHCVTGPEAMALAVGGFCGIVDEKLLIQEEILDACLSHAESRRSYRDFLVIGDSFTPLKAFLKLLDDWEEKLRTHEDISLTSCLRVGLAVSQLNTMPPQQVSGRPFSCKSMAQSLNMQEPSTGFRITEETGRRALCRLSEYSGLSGLGEKANEGLPAALRNLGFPAIAPRLPGKTHMESSLELFRPERSNDLEQLSHLRGYPRGLFTTSQIY